MLTLDLVIDPLALIVVPCREDMPAPAPAMLTFEVSLIAPSICVLCAAMPAMCGVSMTLARTQFPQLSYAAPVLLTLEVPLIAAPLPVLCARMPVPQEFC